MRVARYGLLGMLMLLPVIGWAQDEGDAASGDENLSMEERMQQQMSAKLGKKLSGPKIQLGGSLDKKLSNRVEEKNSEINEQLEAQAETVTDVDRAGSKDKESDEDKQEQAATADAGKSGTDAGKGSS